MILGIYTYHVKEYSRDNRLYLIESENKLTEDEVHEALLEVALVDDATNITKDGIKVTFQGTQYGDDAQVNIEGNLKEEK